MNKNEKAILEIKNNVIFGHNISFPVVDTEKCKGCAHCIKVCPALVFVIKDNKSVVAKGNNCNACGHCWSVCPENAIIQEDVVPKEIINIGDKPAVSAENLQLLIRERRSVRVFKDIPISEEHLKKIIEAGRYGPTGSNRQDVNYIVVNGFEKVSELRRLTENYMEKMFSALNNKLVAKVFELKMGKPTIQMIKYYSYGYNNLKKNKENKIYWPLAYGSAAILVHAKSYDASAPFNCAVSIYNAALMAYTMGLGSCFTGFVNIGANMDKKMNEFLGIPKGNKCFGAMVVGYPDIKYLRHIERKSPDVKWI